MPELVRLYIRHCLIGFGLAVVFVALLLGLDVAGLRGLVLTTPGGGLAVAMLVVFNGLVFAGVQFGIAVMRLGRDEPGGRGRGFPSARGPVSVRSAVRVVAGPQRP